MKEVILITTNFNLPDFPDFTVYEKLDKDSFWDNQEYSQVNETLIKSIIKLRHLNKKISEYERKKVQSELKYKHHYRLLILDSQAKTESTKKISAEIQCEQLEVEIAYYDEIIKELTRYAYSIRTELDVLKTIANNIRQELRLM